MAKRPTVDVDEEYLKEIMAGGVSRQQKKEQPDPVAEQPPDTSETQQTAKEEKETPQQAEVKETVKPVRKRREAQDYESLFLERKASVVRRQTYIGAQLYDKINSFLPVIAGHTFSITSYINNILSHHLEMYKDDINELYERKSQKPF
jgi:type IV secretory pathway VirB10-like protein